MEIEANAVSLVKRVPRVRNGYFCVNVKYGTRLIAILGIIFAYSCTPMMSIKDRHLLTIMDMLLFISLALFALLTLFFVVTSVISLVATVNENPVLFSYYIGFSIIYLTIQLILVLIIPFLLLMDEKYPVPTAMSWVANVIITALVGVSQGNTTTYLGNIPILTDFKQGGGSQFDCWTYFMTAASTYKKNMH